MEELRESQFCGVQRIIFDTAATIREAIAQAGVTATPLCIFSRDFKETFDKISHKYLYAILERYALSESVITGIRNLYANATSSVQINGYMTKPIPSQYSIREGCPMSVQFYA